MQHAQKPVNMQDFIRGKEVDTAGLRVSTKANSRAANSGQTRARPTQAIQQHVKDDRSRAPAPKGQEPFWNTGDSSLGDTSDTPSAHEIHRAQSRLVDQKATHFADERLDDGADGLPSEDESEDEGDEDEHDERGITEDIGYDPKYGSLNQIQLERMRMVDEELNAARGPLSMAYVEGDSYPSTTSGPPSMIEADGSRSFQAIPEHATAPKPSQRRGQITDQHHHQPEGYQQRPGRGRPPHVSRAEQHQVQQDHSGNTQLGRTLARPQEPTHQETDGNFTWGKGPRPRTSNRQPLSKQNSPVPAQIATKQASAVKDARRGHPTQGERTQRQSNDLNHPKSDVKPPAKRETIGTAMRPAPRVLFEPQQAGHFPAEGTRPQTAQDDAEMPNSEPKDAQEEPFEKEPSPETDFDVPELFDMDFSELKSQPFDVDPRDDSASFPGIASDDPIEKQMETASVLQPEDQHAFFASLPIDEWEQAGDWFLGRFGETLAKLKGLRQEKRKAARAFEKEIEGRHVAVTKKRKLTEAALGDMKESGKMILASKPKKAKTG